MAKKIVVLATHGIGKSKPDFADDLGRRLMQRLTAIGGDIVFQPIFWSDVLDARQDLLVHRMKDEVRARWIWLRDFVVENLSDASAYVFTGDGNLRYPLTAYYQINRRVYDAMKSLVDSGLADDHTVVVGITHSMGGHVLSNYVWDIGGPHPERVTLGERTPTSFEKFEKLAGLFMTGCNVPILLMGYDESEQVPIKFPGTRHTLGRDAALWQTFFDKDDVLGYPVAPIYKAYYEGRVTGYPCDTAREVAVTDAMVSVGGFFTGWNPLSHNEYWSDPTVLDAIAAFVRKIHARIP